MFKAIDFILDIEDNVMSTKMYLVYRMQKTIELKGEIENVIITLPFLNKQ